MMPGISLSHPGKVIAHRDGLSVVDCHHCHCAHLSPLPFKAEVDQRYGQDDAFYENGQAWFDKERAEHEAGLWEPMYRWQARKLFEVAPEQDPYLVDIGTGAGWFVDFWRSHYHYAYGVEPSKTARKCGPCPDFIEPDIEQVSLRFATKKPVYLRLALVLEHILDPKGFLKETLAIFPWASAVMVVVPNEFNPLQNKINRRFAGDSRRDWFVGKDHLNYFTPSSLRQVMEEAGMEVKFTGVTAPVELAAVLGVNYIGNDDLGRKVHQARLNLERLPGVIDLYQWLFRRFGWGREIVMIGVPKGNR